MDILVAFLASAGSTKIYRQNLYQILKGKRSNFNDDRIRRCLHELKTKGVVKLDRGIVYVNAKQLKKLKNNRNQINRKSKPGKSETILIFYDIPEATRSIRRILRDQLKFWDYTMIQQSVWLGDGPLPSDFTDQLKKWGVYDQVQIIKLNSLIKN